MKQEGAQKDDRLGGYKLPVCDVDTERRNFPGTEKKQWYTLDEIREGDFFGTTDTDSETDVDKKPVGMYMGRGNYTKDYRKSTAKMRPYKSSSPRTKDN